LHQSSLSPRTACCPTGKLIWLGVVCSSPKPCPHLCRHRCCLLQGKVTVGRGSFLLLCLWSSSRRRGEALLPGCCLAPDKHCLGCVWSVCCHGSPGADGSSTTRVLLCCRPLLYDLQSQTCKCPPFLWVKLSFPKMTRLP